MALISLTIKARRGKPVNQVQLIDTDDIMTPVIPTNGGLDSSFVLSERKKGHFSNSNDLVASETYVVDETVQEVAALSASMFSATVTSQNGKATTPNVVMGFSTHLIAGRVEPNGGGAKFSYQEGGNPALILFQVSDSLSSIASQTTPSGGGGGPAAAGSLTGTTLASNVVSSSLTSFGSSPALTGTPTAPTATTGTSTTQIASTAFVENSLTSRLSSLNNQRLGTVFIDYFASASNYTQTQTAGSQTFNSGYVTMTGGTNSLNNKMMYNYNGTGTLLDDHIVTHKCIVTANASSYGPGVGMQINPIEDNSYAVFLNTSAGGSRGQIALINPLNNAVITTSTTAITFTNSTDSIELSFRYAVNKVIATARNITTPTQTVSSVVIPNIVTLEYEWSPTSTTTPVRVARPSVYCYGGAHNVYSLKMESDLIQNPLFTLIGDSRAFGLGCTSFKSCYANLTGIRGGYKTMVWARGGATATSLLANISELGTFFKGGHKGYVMIAVGVNDAFAGRTLAQFQSDYIALIQAIQAFGGTPIVTKIANLTSTYSGQGPVNTLVNSYNAWLITLPFKQVDENTPLNLSGYLNVNNSSDGVHLSDVGMAVEANSLNSQLATLNVLYPTATYTGSGGTFTVPQAMRIIGGASIQGTVTQGTLLSGETTGQNATVTFGTVDVTRQTYSQWCQNPTNYAQVAHYNSSFAGNHTGTSIANAASSDFQNTAGGVIGGKLVVNANGSYLLSGSTSTNAGIGITTAGIRIGAISTIHNAATAWLHLPAGTATAGTAPLKFTSGTNLTTAETGAFEYNGTNLFFTRTGTTRENVITTGSVNTVTPTSPNRTITVVIDGVTYYIAAKTTND